MIYIVISLPFIAATPLLMWYDSYLVDKHGGYCYSTIPTFLIFCPIFIAIILFIAGWISYECRKEDKEIEKKFKEDKIKEDEQKLLDDKYKQSIEKTSQRYGIVTRYYDFGTKSVDNSILLFADSKKIWIFGKVYDFDDILDCNIKDEPHVEKASVTFKTTTSSGSMLGRAVVGGILTGGVGAIIGGVTAKKKTVAVPLGSDKTIHDFTVVININDLSSPIVYVRCGSDEMLANEVFGLINVIIHKKEEI